MHIGKSQKKYLYYMNNQQLEEITQEKDLGILISNDLKVSQQCQSACIKATRILGIIESRPFRSREQKVHRENFRSVEHLLPGSKKSKNFRSMELSQPRNFHSSGANVPWTFAPQTIFMPFNFCSCGTFAPILKKLWKAGKQCVHWHILANVRCCLLERKWCHVGLYNNG